MSEAAGRSLLQICPNDHPPFKDICRYYAAAARTLGWSVTTFFLGPPQADPLDDAVYLNAADLRRAAALGRSLRRAWQSEAGRTLGVVPPTLALCHRYRAYRILLASDLPVKKIVTVAHEFGFFARRQRRLTVRARRLAGRRDLVFAGVSDAVQRELLAVDRHAVLLPNGVDLARADRLRLHPKKSPALALEGFRLAAREMPGAQLVFIGSGELAASLQRAARDLPVTFAGFVPEAARYFSGLDLLLLPSSSSEAFGMVALEAMAAELPVLSSPAPGPSYVLGSRGDYFQPATPPMLAQALESAYGRWRAPDHGGVATKAARERASDLFSLDAAAKRLRQLVEPVAPDQ